MPSRCHRAAVSALPVIAALFATVPAPAADLFPFAPPWDDGGDGGVTDLSAWNDKPAGRDGFVTVAGAHLVTGGKRLRLLGVNIVFGSAAPSHEDADGIARRLARFGVNIVRLHHMDSNTAPRGLLQKDRASLDPATLDRMDYFVAALRREGIYSDLNLHVGRIYPGFAMPDLDGPQYWKGVDLFHPAMIAAQKDYARALLSHVNPYTGNAYAAEPAVALVEINNEDGLIRTWLDNRLSNLPQPLRAELAQQWRAWLTARYHDDAGLAQAWGISTEPLGAEMFGARVGATSSEPGWTMQLVGDAKATVAATPAGLTLAMTAKGAEPWHTQLHQNKLAFVANRAYTLTLKLRADHPMTVTAAAMQAHAPWGRLWSDTLTVGPDWRTYTLTFVPSTGDDVARLTLTNLGGEIGTLDVAEASLKPGGRAGLAESERLQDGTLDVFDKPRMQARTAAAQRDWLTFLWETEAAYWAEMNRFLKQDLGVRPLIIGSQTSFSPSPIQAMFDVVDDHAYWQHPRFPRKPWDRNDWFIRNSPMAGDDTGGTLPDLALRRAPGKPFVVSEYNHPAPSLFQAEAMPLAAAYGALQDWDGLFIYSYGAHDQDWRTGFVADFFDSHANPVKMVSLLSAATYLRRGDVAAAPPAPAGAVPPASAWIEAMRTTPKLPSAASFGAARDAALTRRVDTATPVSAISPLPLTSVTGELVWGRDGLGGKTVTLDTPRSKALIGARLGTAFDAHGVTLEVTQAANDWAVLTATAMTAADFASPGRILVTALGQQENTDQRWRDAEKTTTGRDFGRAPALVEGIGGRVTLPVAASRVTAYALDERGRRREPIPVSGSERATVQIGARWQTLWYDIEIR